MKPWNYRQFSCPERSGDDRATFIAVAHGTASVEMLLSQKRDLLRSRSHGLVETLERWLGTTTDFETTWDLSFGRVLRALESDDVSAVDVLVDVALRLAARGFPGRWAATLSEGRRLCWDGAFVLPAAREVSLDSSGAAAALELKGVDGGRFVAALHREENGWSAEGLERLLQVGRRRPITLFPSDAVPRDMIVEDDFHSIFAFPPVTPDVAQPFADALELLARHAPVYLTWVERVLRGVVVCRCQESRTRSSSWMHAPGIVLVSWSANPIEIAEMLVHESSHQRFYLVSRVGPVVDGSDAQQYYSPAVQRHRPLSKILIGYHAFANMLLFYRTLLRSGLAEDPHCRALEARLTAEVEALERPLRDSPALTDIGRDLCQPLMERLREAPSIQVSA
ncbi:aKG-HExxH-type peptide beta-hydroxylase [Sorangium sp. So ce1335]|uniref:aKG-HExxH-type peptide beta-hydroxylase n=1 Tax=Sorangium sp. So ce1335 TaxID=3133335 RepID=UPI003F5F759C